MKQPNIKICGITRPQDAKLATQLGADMIGLVFYSKSPRSVNVERAIEICNVLPDKIITVGVFVNQNLEDIQRISNAVPIDVLQMHGSESPIYCKLLPLPFIKAIQVKKASDINDSRWLESDAKALLLDTKTPEAFGGTGQTFDWRNKPKNVSKPLILAGGLTADNVGQAITVFAPDAVDVSSGVEAAPGIKDPKKLEQFIRAIREHKNESIHSA